MPAPPVDENMQADPIDENMPEDPISEDMPEADLLEEPRSARGDIPDDATARHNYWICTGVCTDEERQHAMDAGQLVEEEGHLH
jgi:hypothetical protein